MDENTADLPVLAPTRRQRMLPKRVGGIVLVALDVGLHVLRRHQPHLVAKLREFTCPIV